MEDHKLDRRRDYPGIEITAVSRKKVAELLRAGVGLQWDFHTMRKRVQPEIKTILRL